jgi:hypothetical protein
MKKIMSTVLALIIALAIAPLAQAGLYTTNYGVVVPELINCDDCSSAKIAFGGGQTIDFFGTNYDGLYISTNGYVTFDAGHIVFGTEDITTQTVGPMIAGLFTDLDTSADPDSNIYVNTSTTGEIVVTYDMVTHSLDQTLHSTFQLLVRSDQKSIPAGQGQLGFFYGEINDTNDVSAGFGDGLDTVDPREVSFASVQPGTTLSNNDPRYFTLNGGGTVEPPPVSVPEPSGLALLALGLGAIMAFNRRRRT